MKNIFLDCIMSGRSASARVRENAALLERLNCAGVANRKEAIEILSAKNPNIDILTEKKTLTPINQTVTVAVRLKKEINHEKQR